MATTPSATAASRPRVVSLTIEYPTPHRPGQAVFVRARIQHVAALTDLTVLAPVALYEYSNPHQKRLPGGVPLERRDEAAVVVHPRWVYPPFGTPINVVCLFLAVLRHGFRLWRQGRCDLIDAHFGYPDGVAAALLGAVLRRPFIVTLRGNEPTFAQSRLRRWCISWAFRRAACVVAVSEQLRQFAIAHGADPKRSRVIGNGVNTGLFHPRDQAGCRARHDLPAGAKIIVSAGSLLQPKGHHHVIAAVAALAARGVDACLVVAGSESRGGVGFERSLREITATLNMTSRVRFTGWVPPETLAELMCAADVLCLASDSEGWPNVVHEALSSGTPVVTTDVGSVREMIPSAQFGTIVPVGDQPALIDALADALARPWDRAAIAACGQARSWHHVADEVLEIVQEVLGRPDASAAWPGLVVETRR